MFKYINSLCIFFYFLDGFEFFMILYFKYYYFDILNYWGKKGIIVLIGNKLGIYFIGFMKLMLRNFILSIFYMYMLFFRD